MYSKEKGFFYSAHVLSDKLRYVFGQNSSKPQAKKIKNKKIRTTNYRDMLLGEHPNHVLAKLPH